MNWKGRWSPTIVLVVVAAATYVVTHFGRLEDFPIYYLFDEAIQVCHAEDYIQRGFRGPEGNRFPTFFPVAWDASICVSVYVQIAARLIAGENSIWVSRFATALFGCLFPLALAWALRRVFEIQGWWIGILVAAAIPVWFLHSRTALVLAYMVGFYAIMLAAYLGSHKVSPWLLHVSVAAGALAIYSYAAAQAVIPLTAAVFLLVNFRHHIRMWKHSLGAALLFVVLMVPLVRFRLTHQDLLKQQLSYTSSPLMKEKTWPKRVAALTKSYGEVMSPRYWFFQWDQPPRHRMLGYGNLSLWMLPFFVAGLGLALWRIKDARYRTVLAALAVAPLAGVVSGPEIWRVLVVVVPAAFLVTLGLDLVITATERWIRTAVAHVLVASCLAGYSVYMLGDALRHGPTWFSEYGLYGMQWGAKELFLKAIPEYLSAHPKDVLSVSPDWANGGDIFTKFFHSPRSVEMGGLSRFPPSSFPIPENMVFVEVHQDVPQFRESDHFASVKTVYTLAAPDGQPAFDFIKVTHRADLAEVLAKEAIEMRKPVQDVVTIGDLSHVPVLSSRPDTGSIQSAFDGDPISLVRGLEANPFMVEISLAGRRRLRGIRAESGGDPYRVSLVVTGTGPDAGQKLAKEFELVPDGKHSFGQVDFEPIWADSVHLEFLEIRIPPGQPTHMHLYELKLIWEVPK
jgi:hypothetical protein